MKRMKFSKAYSHFLFTVVSVRGQVRRIGHGRCLAGRPDLQAELARRNVCLEICLTSNCVPYKKEAVFADHPVPEFIKVPNFK
jgi:adenosine deaminase